MAKFNELDRIFVINYVVGAGVIIMSLIGFFLDVFFKDLPLVSNYFNFHKGIGLIQTFIAIVFILIMIGALEFIRITYEYQQAYGAS